jgi:hypothetical protein
MISFSDEFILCCSARVFFNHLKTDLPSFLKNHPHSPLKGYSILESCEDNKYHRVLIQQKNSLSRFFPKMLLSFVPESLRDIFEYHVEENVLDSEDLTIHWKASPRIDPQNPLYTINGIIKLADHATEENQCRVIITIEFEVNRDALSLQSRAARYLAFQVVEKRVPSLVFHQLRTLYNSFCDHYHSNV